MNYFAKARKYGLTPANIISWLSLQSMAHLGKWPGTIALHVKARLLGVQLGKNVVAHGPVGLLRWPGGHITIGDNTKIISSWRRATASALAFPTRLRVFGPGASIEIGEGCELSGASITARSTRISLGKGVLVGPNCVIIDSDFHAPWPPNQRSVSPGVERDAPVTIGDYAWLGLNSIILKGVSIGNGCIIGAGSVVTRDIPDNCLACGSPCKVVRVYGGYDA